MQPNLDRSPPAERGPNAAAPQGIKSLSLEFRPVPPQQRARASNDPAILAGVDQRSALARRFRDLVGDIASDQGGTDAMTAVRQQLVRRFAAASVLLEGLDERIARGEAVDVAEYSTLVSTLVRLAQRLGLNRRQKRIASVMDILSGEESDDE